MGLNMQGLRCNAIATAGSVRRLTWRRGNETGRQLDECALLFAKANTPCSNRPADGRAAPGCAYIAECEEVLKVSMLVCLSAHYALLQSRRQRGVRQRSAEGHCWRNTRTSSPQIRICQND